MSTWHYQLIKHVYPNGKVHYAVHEYYTATLGGGEHTLSPVTLGGEDPDDIQCLIIHVLNDIGEHGIIEVEHDKDDSALTDGLTEYKFGYGTGD